MVRLLLIAALAAPLVAGCSPAFKDKRTPSGGFCSDMPVIPAGQEPDEEYHRLQPIASDPKARTEAQRLESLRKAACGVGADAVIEAVNEEVRGDDATYVTVSSGTAVIWIRHNKEGAKPLSTHAKSEPSAEPSAEPEAPPPEEPPAEPEEPPPAKSAKPAAKPAPTSTTKKK